MSGDSLSILLNIQQRYLSCKELDRNVAIFWDSFLMNVAAPCASIYTLKEDIPSSIA